MFSRSRDNFFWHVDYYFANNCLIGVDIAHTMPKKLQYFSKKITRSIYICRLVYIFQ